MISSKAIITYKRKRLFSQLKPTHGLKGSNSSPESPRSISSTSLSKKDEPRHLLVKQKGHDRKRIPRGKRLCSVCSEPHNSGTPVQKRIQEPKKSREINCLEGSEMGPITLRSRKVLLKLNPGKNASSKSKDCSPQVDAYFGKRPDSTQINFHSNVDCGFTSEVVSVEGSRGSQLKDTDSKKSRSVCPDSSIETGCHTDVSFLKTCPENNDPPYKVKSNITGADSHFKRFSNPLITFSRRAKKKCVDGIDNQKKLIDENRHSVVEWSNCAFSVCSFHQGTSQKCNSVDQSTAKVSEMNQLLVLRQDGQGEIACKEEDHSLQSTLSGGSSKTKIGRRDADQEQDTRKYTSIGSPVSEGVQELSSDQHHPSSHPKPGHVDQEDNCPFKYREISLTDVTNEAKQSDSAKIGAPTGDASIIISTGATEKSEGITGLDILEGTSLAHLELSVAPPSSLSPSKRASNQKMHISAKSLPANNLLSTNKLLSNGMNSEIAVERSCKLPEEHLHSANPSCGNHAIVLDEETTDGGSVLELVEIPDETVQEMHNHRTLNNENLCSSTSEDGINHEQTCDGKVSSVLSMNIYVQDPCLQSISVDILDDVAPLACISQGTRTDLDFQGRFFVPQSVFEKNPRKQPPPTETSLCSPHFLGLSLPMNTDSAVDTVTPYRGRIHNQQPGWQDTLLPSASDKNLSVARHKQLIDNIVTSAGLKVRQNSPLEKFKGSTHQWSEEELDFLWVGVRRHGRDNWDAVLRDPKLHFSEWRVAEDLAEQWDVEQSKVLYGTLIQPVRMSKADSSPTISGGLLAKKAEIRSRYGGYSADRHTSKFPNLRTETELSLGDVYVQKEESIQMRYPFHLSGTASELPLSKNDSRDFAFGITDSVLQNMGSKQQNSIKGQRSRRYSDRKRARYDMGFSILQKKTVNRSTSHGPWSGEINGHGKNKGILNEDMPAGLPTNGNLPHWLREVFGTPQRPRGLAVPSSVSAIAHSVSLLYNDKPIIPPFSDPCTVPLPPKDPRQMLNKSRTNSKIAGLRVSDLSASIPPPAASCTNVSSMESEPDLCSSTLIPTSENQVSDQNNAGNLNKTCSDPPNDLIVIDSDASSEETISDDRSGMH